MASPLGRQQMGFFQPTHRQTGPGRPFVPAEIEHAAAENTLSLKEGFRLLSVYQDKNLNKFWIITEADRSSTTILLPQDY
jgi:hypothetical protein